MKQRSGDTPSGPVRSIRTTTSIVAIFALLVVCVVGSLAALPSRPGEAAFVRQGVIAEPCGAALSRHVEPRIVGPGALLSVTVRLRYDCRSEAPAFALLIVAGGRPDRTAQALRFALSDLARALPFENGTTVATVDVLAEDESISPWRDGEEGRDALARFARDLPEGSAADDPAWRRSLAQSYTAIIDASPTLRPVVLIFDGGGIPTGAPSGLPTIPSTMASLRGAADVTVVLAPSSPTAMPLLCAIGIVGGSCRILTGPELDIALVVARVLTSRGGARLTWWTYRDALQRETFTVVPGSPQPSAHVLPPRFPNEVVLEQDVTRPMDDLSLTFAARVLTDAAGTGGRILTFSPAPLPDVYLYQGELRLTTLSADNPEVCIHRTGRRAEDCGEFEARIARTPTATAFPTASATPFASASATASATATATEGSGATPTVGATAGPTGSPGTAGTATSTPGATHPWTSRIVLPWLEKPAAP